MVFSNSFFGGSRADTLTGGSGEDYVFGLGGRDSILGEAGDDFLFGGRGRDTIDGGSGDDFISGGRGADLLSGGSGDDVIRGGKGQDTLVGGAGSDALFGMSGRDVFVQDISLGLDDADVLFGGAGRDTLLITLTQSQLDELTAVGALDDFAALGGTAAGVDFSSYALSFTLNLFVQSIEKLEFDIVTTPNSAPEAKDDRFEVSENEAVDGSLLVDNGFGPDLDIDPSDVILVTAVNGNAAAVGSQIALASGALLTVLEDGTFEYLQDGAWIALTDGETAQEVFTYTISDAAGETSSATVTIEISGETGATIIGNVAQGSLLIDGGVTKSGDTTLDGIVVDASFISDGGIIGNQLGSEGIATLNGGTWLVDDGGLIVGNNGVGRMDLSDGARVEAFSGSADINTPATVANVFIGGNQGTSTGFGEVTVVGAGSVLSATGIDSVISVGRNGGTGSLSVSDGGLVSTAYANVGRDGGSGTLSISGAGSVFSVSGQSPVPFEFFGGGMNIGRAGSGTVEILNGGVLDFDTSLDAQMSIGRSGGTGLLSLTGDSSLTTDTAQQLTVSVGRQQGDGQVMLTDGSSIDLSTTVATQFNIGADGTGVVDVSGGSSIQLASGGSVNLLLANEGSGVLNLSGQSEVELASQGNATVGIGNTGAGTVNMTGQSVISGSAIGNLNFRVGLFGTGELNVIDGSQILLGDIANTTSSLRMIVGDGTGENTELGQLHVDGAGSLVSIAGAGPLVRFGVGVNSDGEATFSNGARYEAQVIGDDYSSTVVGGGASGKLNILSGSSFVVDGLDDSVFMGVNTVSGDGHVFVSGQGSLLAIGGLSPVGTSSAISLSATSAEGTGILEVEDGGEVRAGDILVGNNASLFAEGGTIDAKRIRLEGGTLGEEGVIGTASLSGQLLFSPGFEFNFDIAGAASADMDRFELSGQAVFGQGGNVAVSFINGHAPTAGDTISLLTTTDGIVGGLEQISLHVAGLTSDFEGSLAILNDELVLNVTSSGAAAVNGDYFLGGTQDDTFDGGLGDDVIDGGAGFNTLTGGSGSDTFIFIGTGTNQILDFEAGVGLGDRLDVSQLGFADFAEVLLNAADNSSGNVVISSASGGTVELVGVAESTLAQDDFSL